MARGGWDRAQDRRLGKNLGTNIGSLNISSNSGNREERADSRDTQELEQTGHDDRPGWEYEAEGGGEQGKDQSQKSRVWCCRDGIYNAERGSGQLCNEKESIGSGLR